MSKTRNGYGGLSLWLSLVGLGAPLPDTGLQIEIHIYNYSKVSHEMLVRAEQESARIFERIGRRCQVNTRFSRGRCYSMIG